MQKIEAQILLKNLLKRIRNLGEDNYEIVGYLTVDELTALKVALNFLDTTENITVTPLQDFNPALCNEESGKNDGRTDLEVESKKKKSKFELNTSIFDIPMPPDDRRLCLDFGTAMSKVTLVIDKLNFHGLEDIHVLELGVAGDQEEVSETMLISSVYIDNSGKLWFGKKAHDLSRLTPDIQRLDNIKRYLSEEGLQDSVDKRFNPTSVTLSYADLVLAYLTYLTWSVNKCLEQLKEPRNIARRFAMPCFDGTKARETHQKLAQMLGEAQVLADTFYEEIPQGVSLELFVSAVSQLRVNNQNYHFIREGITEPLGVAGSLISWEENVNSLVMVVDVGAGTSDFSLYRVAYNPETNKSVALQVANSTVGITEAGNYLDNLLRALILKRANITHEHPHFKNYLGDLELSLRDYKEQLFLNGEIGARLFNGEIISVHLEEFLELPQVNKFAQSLLDCRDKILNTVNASFIKGAPNNTLALALTGGGASLPMVKALAQGSVNLHGKQLNLVQTQTFPKWLSENYDELEQDYTRIAVSLGGARKRIIEDKGVATITADVKSPHTLNGFY